MIRPTLPAGVVPAGATHFYYDSARPTEAPNPWRRLESDGKWHMLRGETWNQIAGSNSHRFYPVSDTLRPVAADEMTLRDYFAARAMQALLTRMSSGPGNKAAADRMTRESAEYAYATADAMLAARESEK